MNSMSIQLPEASLDLITTQLTFSHSTSNTSLGMYSIFNET